KTFLGFSGYYRRFVKNYATIVKPLNDLTRGYQSGKPKSKTKNKGGSRKPPVQRHYGPFEPFGPRWDERCERAFQEIIACLTHAPVLVFADPSKPFILHTDASLEGHHQYTGSLQWCCAGRLQCLGFPKLTGSLPFF
ncbi:hypothetical protein G0U57_002796, partial [Chelydra serpentina]